MLGNIRLDGLQLGPSLLLLGLQLQQLLHLYNLLVLELVDVLLEPHDQDSVLGEVGLVHLSDDAVLPALQAGGCVQAASLGVEGRHRPGRGRGGRQGADSRGGGRGLQQRHGLASVGGVGVDLLHEVVEHVLHRVDHLHLVLALGVDNVGYLNLLNFDN